MCWYFHNFLLFRLATSVLSTTCSRLANQLYEYEFITLFNYSSLADAAPAGQNRLIPLQILVLHLKMYADTVRPMWNLRKATARRVMSDKELLDHTLL